MKKWVKWSFLGIMVIGILFLFYKYNQSTSVYSLKRPSYKQGEQVYEIDAKIDGELYQLEIPVQPKELEQEKIEALFKETEEWIKSQILGENISFYEIRSDLNFVETDEKYEVSIEYNLDDYSVINYFGELNNIDITNEGSLETIHVTIRYQEIYKTFDIEVVVYPPIFSEKEQKEITIVSKIKEMDLQTEDYMVLPTEINGEKIEYIQTKSNPKVVIILFLINIIIYYYYKKYIIPKNLEKKKMQQIQMDYSDIVAKLTLLIGAGMSGPSAFAKMAYDYREAKEKGNMKIQYAYEEIVLVSNKIATGISEIEAYSYFGRACKSHNYIKLSNMMIQNIKKGGSEFVNILQNEMEEAFMERKAQARKRGEEAGTKLLLPMSMMLFIVLVIIIVPAFLSF